jgi:hypothetical protein
MRAPDTDPAPDAPSLTALGQQRLHGELTLAKVQLAEAREEIASLGPQREVAKKGDRRKAAHKQPPEVTSPSELTRLIAASQ